MLAHVADGDRHSLAPYGLLRTAAQVRGLPLVLGRGALALAGLRRCAEFVFVERDEVANDAIIELERALELGKGLRIGGEAGEDVIARFAASDLVGQLAPAPLLDLDFFFYFGARTRIQPFHLLDIFRRASFKDSNDGKGPHSAQAQVCPGRYPRTQRGIVLEQLCLSMWLPNVLNTK